MRVLEIVSREFEVRKSDLKAPSRSSQNIAFARQAAMFLEWKCDPLHPSLSEVGRRFKRDRTTVRHAIAVMNMHREAREDFDDLMVRLENELTASFVCA